MFNFKVRQPKKTGGNTVAVLKSDSGVVYRVRFYCMGGVASFQQDELETNMMEQVAKHVLVMSEKNRKRNEAWSEQQLLKGIPV